MFYGHLVSQVGQRGCLTSAGFLPGGEPSSTETREPPLGSLGKQNAPNLQKSLKVPRQEEAPPTLLKVVAP